MTVANSTNLDSKQLNQHYDSCDSLLLASKLHVGPTNFLLGTPIFVFVFTNPGILT